MQSQRHHGGLCARVVRPSRYGHLDARLVDSQTRAMRIEVNNLCGRSQGWECASICTIKAADRSPALPLARMAAEATNTPPAAGLRWAGELELFRYEQAMRMQVCGRSAFASCLPLSSRSPADSLRGACAMVTVQARNTLDAKRAATPSDEHTCGPNVRSTRVWGAGCVTPAPVPQLIAAQPCDIDPLVDSPSRGYVHRLEDAANSSCCTVRE